MNGRSTYARGSWGRASKCTSRANKISECCKTRAAIHMSLVGMGVPCFLQLPVNSAVMMRGLFVGIEHTNAGFQQKASQDGFVARSLTAHSKSGPQFSKHDEGQPDFLGEFDGFNDRHIAPAQVGIAIRVERQLHRHISSSIVSCAANARSKAASFRQLPAMSPWSRCRLRSPAMPAPRARASMATSFKLLPRSRAALRRALSKVSGTLRMVYCMHTL